MVNKIKNNKAFKLIAVAFAVVCFAQLSHGLKMPSASRVQKANLLTTSSSSYSSLRDETKDEHRSLQANYRARYRGRFQLRLGGECTTSGRATLHATCAGTIRLLGTSHSTITCSVQSQEGQDVLECNNSCGSSECRSVYVNEFLRAEVQEEEAIWGEIDFTCEGSNVEDVVATFSYDAHDGYTCPFSSSDHNVAGQYVQLGISCKGFDLVFFPGIFECDRINFVDTVYVSTACVDDATQNCDSRSGYTCYSRYNCGLTACDISVPPIIAYSDLYNLPFYDTGDIRASDACIESLSGSPVPSVAIPTLSSVPEGSTFTSQFVAFWRLNNGSGCTDELPTIRIECTNGDIELVDERHDSTSCQKTSPSVLECRETEQDAFNSLALNFVTYGCVSTSAIPQTTAEWSATTVTCEDFRGGTLSHYITINEVCFPENREDLEIYSDEYFFECFNAPIRNTGNSVGNGDQFACAQFAAVPIADGDQSGTIPAVRVTTDPFRWNQEAFQECYNIPEGIFSSAIASGPELDIESKMTDSNKQDSGSSSSGHVKPFHAAFPVIGMIVTWLYLF